MFICRASREIKGESPVLKTSTLVLECVHTPYQPYLHWCRQGGIQGRGPPSCPVPHHHSAAGTPPVGRQSTVCAQTSTVRKEKWKRIITQNTRNTFRRRQSWCSSSIWENLNNRRLKQFFFSSSRNTLWHTIQHLVTHHTTMWRDT